jgi:hypothetical protein
LPYLESGGKVTVGIGVKQGELDLVRVVLERLVRNAVLGLQALAVAWMQQHAIQAIWQPWQRGSGCKALRDPIHGGMFQKRKTGIYISGRR